MTHDDELHFDTLAIHAAQAPDAATGAIMPPVVLSTTFAQRSPGQPGAYEYSRSGNPTRNTLERCVAQLEGGRHGLAFSSGCAATSAVLQTLSPGDHVLACDDVYGGTYRLMDQVFSPLGIGVDWVDMADPRAVEGALRTETKLLWVETPTNPLLKVVDIKTLGWMAGNHGALLVVDNTFATPALQKPLEMGAHAVVHSTTKYLNGHADVVGGLIVSDHEELTERLRFVQNAVGAVPSPFDCYLVLRGLKTLPIRMERHCASALAIAKFLSGHPAVEKVHYPGLDSHPQAELAQRQMHAPGGMVSFVVRGGADGARTLLEGLRLFVCAESLGGVESLAEHPASMTHAAIPLEVRTELGIVDGLVRLSVGLEAETDLRRDLSDALSRVP